MITALPLLISLFLTLPLNQSGTVIPQVQKLESGKTLEGEISGGQQQTFQINLADGQFANFVIDLHGVDVIVRMLGPDAKLIAEFDDELRAEGQETPEVVAVAAGNYTLTFAPRSKEAPRGRYAVRLVEIRLATENDRSLQDSRRFYAESARLWRAGKYDDALTPAKQAVEIREKILGPMHPQVATALTNLAIVNYLKGSLAEALSMHQRALEIREKYFGPDHPLVASSQNNIAEIHRLRGEYAAADSLYRLSIAGWEKSVGPDHIAVAYPLGNLAIVRRVLGDYSEAELLYQRALKIREKAFGSEHPEVAMTIHNLAMLYRYRGDFEKAETAATHALELWQKVLGPDHANVAAALNNLADIAESKGELDRAEQLYRRSCAVWEKAVGPEHPSFAGALHGLASVLVDKGELDAAEPIYQRVLAINEKAEGPDHPDLALTLDALAQLYSRKGEFNKAEPLYQRALKIREQNLGSNHPDVSQTLTHMSELYEATGRIIEAINTQTRANQIWEHNISINLAMGSERQKLAYLATLSEMTDRSISLHVRSAPNNSAARDLATTTILQRQGRVQDAMSDSLAGLRSSFNSQDRKLLDQLNETTAWLAKLVLEGRPGTSPADLQKQIAAVEEKKEQLENDISRRSAGFYSRNEPITLQTVQAAIPSNAALVEISVYRPFDPTKQSIVAKPRYVVYVIRHDGDVRWQDLDETTTIDNAVDSLRQALRDPKRNDVRRLAHIVDEKIMRPVRTIAGDARHLLISPDGDLNLLPFGALVDDAGHYLIENYECTYLTSGYDLLRLQVPREPKTRSLIVADPTFGETSDPQTQVAQIPVAQTTARTTRDLSQVYFAPLSGTALEANSIHSLFPDALLRAGPNATETVIKSTAAPRILHIATHGFFLQDNPDVAQIRSRVTTRSISATAKIENPLLRSGLALAGANRRSATDDDGILTALEASGLNLWGTKLVVLSACDTGIGEIRNGEGVYGLRRAFVLAGAESLVMSLWPASDYTTRKLMTEYYRNLKMGKGRGEALRAVQLSMLKANPKLHPFYWANFIQSGEWANLQGQRKFE